ncbi:hypothetical protein GGF50DRAFT_120737 [Schizophyllum commune]
MRSRSSGGNGVREMSGAGAGTASGFLACARYSCVPAPFAPTRASPSPARPPNRVALSLRGSPAAPSSSAPRRGSARKLPLGALAWSDAAKQSAQHAEGSPRSVCASPASRRTAVKAIPREE